MTASSSAAAVQAAAWDKDNDDSVAAPAAARYKDTDYSVATLWDTQVQLGFLVIGMC